MFAVHCPLIEDDVLIWPSSLRGIRNTAQGMEVAFRCACGEDAVWLTGRLAARSVLSSHTLAARAPA